METAIEDAGLDRGPTLTSSWDAACGALTQSLFLTRTGPRAQDLDFEQLLAPPAQGYAGPGPDDSHAADGGEQDGSGDRRGSRGGGRRAAVLGGGRGCGSVVCAGPERQGKIVFRIPESGGTPPTGSCYNSPRPPHPQSSVCGDRKGTRTTASCSL